MRQELEQVALAGIAKRQESAAFGLLRPIILSIKCLAISFAVKACLYIAKSGTIENVGWKSRP
jgi:hypothetical protein